MIKAFDTPRLHIRGLFPEDWIALQEIIRQYNASEYASYDREWPSEPEEFKRVTEWLAREFAAVAVCLREDGELIGLIMVDPDHSSREETFNLGFIFDCRRQGQGYAIEAGRAVLRKAFTEWGAQRFVSGTAAVNRRAVKPLERLGFEKIGEAICSFRNGPDGKPILFSGWNYQLTFDQWGRSEPI